METSMRDVDESLENHRSLNSMFGLDLFVYTPKHLQERLDMHDWFLIDAIKKGKVVYKAHAATAVKAASRFPKL